MKRNTVVLWFALVWVVAVAISCKSDDVNPIDKLMGLYQGNAYPKGFIPRNNPGSRIRLTRTTNDKVHLIAFDVPYRTIGTQTDFKDFEFPNCKIVIFDTSASNNLQQPFARIINTDNNTVMGNFRNYRASHDGVETKYHELRCDFFVVDSAKVLGAFFKWTD
ncbi:MAG: hypothetical protein EAZ32_01295 [Cytophagia bacterium]|jgi:hypothetical protein|nr:MAG: hypothetical protein EAZ32_01295 [Cytophagia bacterium]TAG84761.1 MAG: hypothetical protein EAZ22_00185 [Cytophagales bacterium]